MLEGTPAPWLMGRTKWTLGGPKWTGNGPTRHRCGPLLDRTRFGPLSVHFSDIYLVRGRGGRGYVPITVCLSVCDRETESEF